MAASNCRPAARHNPWPENELVVTPLMRHEPGWNWGQTVWDVLEFLPKRCPRVLRAPVDASVTRPARTRPGS